MFLSLSGVGNVREETWRIIGGELRVVRGEWTAMGH